MHSITEWIYNISNVVLWTGWCSKSFKKKKINQLPLSGLQRRSNNPIRPLHPIPSPEQTDYNYFCMLCPSGAEYPTLFPQTLVFWFGAEWKHSTLSPGTCTEKLPSLESYTYFVYTFYIFFYQDQMFNSKTFVFL